MYICADSSLSQSWAHGFPSDFKRYTLQLSSIEMLTLRGSVDHGGGGAVHIYIYTHCTYIVHIESMTPWRCVFPRILGLLCGFLLHRMPQLTLAIHIHILARLAKTTLSTANVT